MVRHELHCPYCLSARIEFEFNLNEIIDPATGPTEPGFWHCLNCGHRVIHPELWFHPDAPSCHKNSPNSRIAE